MSTRLLGKQVMLHEALYAAELLAANDPEVAGKLRVYADVLTGMTGVLAQLLAEKLGVDAGSPDYSRDDLSCWGPIITIRQAFDGQPVPEVLLEIDPEADWIAE